MQTRVVWVFEIYLQSQERKVAIESDKLADELREAIKSGHLGFYGIDESSGEALCLNWKDAVAVRLSKREWH